jgi:polyisoprenoid-binding protein YceI
MEELMPRLSFKFWYVALLLSLFVPAFARAQSTFEILPSKSSVTFTISTTFNEIEGKAKAFKGSLSIPDAKDLATGTTATITIDTKSMETGNKGRDKDMHKDVIESEKFPEIKIAIKKITADSALYTYKISADITMHGVTKSVDFKTSALSFAGTDGKLSLSISGKVKINMSDWGMTPPSIVVNKVSPEIVVGWSLIAQQK